MVSRIYALDYVVVDSESDALLLENNLIKELQPRYNVLLKDDKTFPWICIKRAFSQGFSNEKSCEGRFVVFWPLYERVLLQAIVATHSCSVSPANVFVGADSQSHSFR